MVRLVALVVMLFSVSLAQDEKQALKRAGELKKQVTSIRGYKFSKEVEVGLYTKDNVKELYTKELRLSISEQKAKAGALIGWKFGFFPRDIKLLETYIAMLTESIAGFYHPRSKQLKLIKDPGDGERSDQLKQTEEMLGIKMADVYMVHELTHAAQDQKFDLMAFKANDDDNDDLSMALDTVIEGEATLVMYRYMFKDNFDAVKSRLGEPEPPKKKWPAYLYQSQNFPYTLGVKFMIDVFDAKGWDGITNMYQQPPLSTEQVLHPEKYLSKTPDYPIVVKLPILKLNELLGKDWKRLDDNVNGEYVIRLMFEEFKMDDVAESAAAGWGGDRYSAWHRAKDGRVLLVWYTTWDTQGEAKKFFDAYAKLLGKKYPDAKKNQATKVRVGLDTKEGSVLMERRQKDVLIIEGADEEFFKNVDSIFQDTKKQELREFTPGKVTFG